MAFPNPNNIYTSNSRFASCKLMMEGTQITQGESGYVVQETFRVQGIQEDSAYIALMAALVAANGGFGWITPLDFAVNLPDVASGLYELNDEYLMNATTMTTDCSFRWAIPKRGDPLPTLITIQSNNTATFAQVFCTDVKARHPGPDILDQAIVVITMQELGKPVDSSGNIITDTTGTQSTGTLMWLVGGAINGTTVNVTSSYSYDTANTPNQLSQVYYRPGSANTDWRAQSTTSGFTALLTVNNGTSHVYSQYAELPSLEGLGGIQYKLRMIFDPTLGTSNHMTSAQDMQNYYNGAMNSQPMGQVGSGSTYLYPPYTLRLRLTMGEFDSLRSLRIDNGSGTRLTLWDVGLNFEYRFRGWQEVADLEYPWSGFPPPDIDNPGDLTHGIPAGKTNGNGWGQFKTLPSVDFNAMNLPDLRLV